MNKREKVLAIGLGIALGGFLSFEHVSDWVTGSSNHPATKEHASALRELQRLEQDKLVAVRESESLNHWRALSLPSDPATACVKYQEYLIRILEKSGLNTPIVSGSSPIEVEGVGVKVQFTVQANATASQIGSFLDQFSSTELLHQITFLSIYQSGGPESPEHAMTAGIEILVLDGDKTELPSLSSARKRNGAARALASNDIFCRPKKPTSFSTEETSIASLLKAFTGEPVAVSQPETSDVPPEPVPSPTKQEDVRFIGVIERGAKKLALFYDADSGKQTMVSVGDGLQEVGLEAKVLGIEKDSVQLGWNQSIQRWRLGKKLQTTENTSQ